MRETTALGAAIAAGLAIGHWSLSPDGSTVVGITR
jgi:glycerol kinase